MSGVSRTSALLSWLPPAALFHNGQLTSYKVFVQHVQTRSYSPGHQEWIVTSDKTTVTLAGLQPLTEYAVTVTAVNAAGAGRNSSALLFETLEEGSVLADL